MQQVKNIKINDYILIRENVCQVTYIHILKKTLRNRTERVLITGKDIFTDAKYTGVYHTYENIVEPKISSHKNYLLFIDDDNCLKLLCDDEKTIMEDVKLDNSQISNEIKEKYELAEHNLIINYLSIQIEYKTLHKIIGYEIEN